MVSHKTRDSAKNIQEKDQNKHPQKSHRLHRLQRSFSDYISPKLFTKEVSAILLITLAVILYSLLRTHEFESCYGVLLDAGSSGTKVSVFSYPCMRTSSVPRFDHSKTISKKFPEPLASFEDVSTSPSPMESHFASLLEFVDSIIPSSQRPRTPIILGATAGMRLIPRSSQDTIIMKAAQLLSESSYYFPQSKASEWCRVISGEEEGAYLWTTVNYLLNYLSHRHSKKASTVATIDLGGASTQIAFIPTHESSTMKSSDNFEMVIKWLNQWRIYTVSYLGYGKRKASELILRNQVEANSLSIRSSCHFQGYVGEQRVDGVTRMVIGTGELENCTKLIRKYVESRRFECEFESSDQCALHRVYESVVPPHMKVYGASGVAAAAHFLGFETQFTLQEMWRSIESNLFFLDWTQVQEKYPHEPELASRMFLAVYVHNLLYYGYNIHPNRPIFVPDSIKHISLGWSLAFFMQKISETSCKEILGENYCMQTVEETMQIK